MADNTIVTTKILDLTSKQLSELTGSEDFVLDQNGVMYRTKSVNMLNDVYNGLDSTSTTKQLTANQGRILKELNDWQNSADGLIFDFDSDVSIVEADDNALTITIPAGRVMPLNSAAATTTTSSTGTLSENGGIVLTLSGGLYLWSFIDDLSSITEGSSKTKWVIAKNVNGTLYSRIPSFLKAKNDNIIATQGVDLDASKPVTGLTIGDIFVSSDTFLKYIAISTTTWSSGKSLATNQFVTDKLDENKLYQYDGSELISVAYQDLSLYESVLPDTPDDPTAKFLNGSRLWSEIALGSGGYAGNLYLSATASDVTGYKTLSYTNDAVETECSASVSSGDGEVLCDTFLFDDGLDVTLLPAGKWALAFYEKVSSAVRTTTIRPELFVRSADDSETILDTTFSYEINNTDYPTTPHEVEKSLEQFTVVATDRLGVRFYASTTSNTARTITIIVGDGRGAYMTTPLELRHNQLRDVNGDTDVQHLTAAEKAFTTVTQTTITSSATPTPTGDSRENELYITALAENTTFANPSGSYTKGNNLIIKISPTTAVYTLAFGTEYTAFAEDLPTTTITGKGMVLGFIYDGSFQLMSVTNQI